MSKQNIIKIEQSELPTMEAFKKEAKTFRENNPHIKSHVQALRELARQKYGYKNWETLRAILVNDSI